MHTAHLAYPITARAAGARRAAHVRPRLRSRRAKPALPAITLAIAMGVAILAVYGALAATAAVEILAVVCAVVVMLFGLGTVLYVTLRMLNAPPEE
jgi:uncharacterized membrane protein